jgi:hypothetical protein
MTSATTTVETKSQPMRLGVTLAAGALCWVGAVIALWRGGLEAEWGQILLLFAPLIIVPLGLRLVEPLSWPGRIAQTAQFGGAVLLFLAFLEPPGWRPALLSLPWLVVTGLICLEGLLRIARRGLTPLDELCRDAALVLLLVGGLWTTASRWGLRPLDFDDTIVLLTANHFHYAGFVMPLVAGLAARTLPGRISTLTALGVLAGVPLVAVGITATKLGVSPLLECLAALVMALSGLGVAFLHLRLAARAGHPLARILFVIAGVSLLFGMGLAGLYGLRFYTGSDDWTAHPWLTIPWMRLLHGSANVFGFALAALAGWLLQPTDRRGGQ